MSKSMNNMKISKSMSNSENFEDRLSHACPMCKSCFHMPQNQSYISGLCFNDKMNTRFIHKMNTQFNKRTNHHPMNKTQHTTNGHFLSNSGGTIRDQLHGDATPQPVIPPSGKN